MGPDTLSFTQLQVVKKVTAITIYNYSWDGLYLTLSQRRQDIKDILQSWHLEFTPLKILEL